MSLIHIIAIPFVLVFFVLLVRYLFERSRAGRRVSTYKRTQALVEQAEQLYAREQELPDSSDRSREDGDA